jgi:uncharacterized membrane protein
VTPISLAADGEGPFDLITGLPVHPLVVHAVVVLVPLTAAGVIAMAIFPKFSRRFGILFVLAGIGAAVTSFVAKQAGYELAKRVGQPGFNHEALGRWMPWFALALAAAVTALWWIDRQDEPARNLRLTIAVVAVVIAVASVVWVIRVGDSGARNVWSGVENLAPSAG